MKKPNVPISSTLPRMAAELFIIVAGVLIALGAQSWWDSRGTADERQRALRALGSDLQLLESTMVGDSLNGAEQMSALRAAIDDPPSLAQMEDSVLIRTIRTAAWNTVIGNERYAFPAWNDLESSGRLDLLPEEVRRSLSELDQQFERLYFSGNDLQTLQFERMDGYVLKLFNGRDLLWTPFLGIRPGNRPDLAALQDGEFRTALVMKLGITVGLMRDLNSALDSLRAVRSQIVAVLSD